MPHSPAILTRICFSFFFSFFLFIKLSVILTTFIMTYFYDASSSNGKKRHPSMCLLQLCNQQIKLTTLTNTGLNIQLSQTLTINAAQDIKILNMYLFFGGGCMQKIFPEMKKLTKYKYISNFQRLFDVCHFEQKNNQDLVVFRKL